MPDIQCDDLCRTMTEQHVAESSGGGADIKATQAFGRTQPILEKQIESAYQLVGATRNVVISPIGGNHIVVRDLCRCLGNDNAVHTDLALDDQTLSFRPAIGEPSVQQGKVKADGMLRIVMLHLLPIVSRCEIPVR